MFPAKRLAEAVNVAADALRSGFLKQILFTIKSKGSVIEYYKFHFDPKGVTQTLALVPLLHILTF